MLVRTIVLGATMVSFLQKHGKLVNLDNAVMTRNER